ncbi:hypothetical protein Bbelb_332450 [Branchiostoma belcheri]|nr:hypothetical protein Bbelb_332450 [Branchiostoma belcheri]
MRVTFSLPARVSRLQFRTRLVRRRVYACPGEWSLVPDSCPPHGIGCAPDASSANPHGPPPQRPRWATTRPHAQGTRRVGQSSSQDTELQTRQVGRLEAEFRHGSALPRRQNFLDRQP